MYQKTGTHGRSQNMSVICGRYEGIGKEEKVSINGDFRLIGFSIYARYL